MSGLNGDDLGAMGETKFADLCARAGLIFNKASERDRAGWDFMINLDVDESADSPLDERRGQPTCVVQVKATCQRNGSVRMTLSMAERLAKDANPCFICILKADEDSEFLDAYLLHITGQRLAAILRRLRQESKKAIDSEPLASAGQEPNWQTAARNARLNKLYIVFTPRKDERIDVSGPALRAALMAACGNDAALYSSQKETQRRELGYSEAPLQVVAKFNPTELSELQDAFLGLRESVEVAEMNGTETRFDITLPQFSHLGGKISIQPAPLDVCRMTFRAPGLLSSAAQI